MVEIIYENDFVLALGALAGNDAVAGVTKVKAANLQGFRVAKVRIAAQLDQKTTAEGPLVWGLAANMSAAQIEAAIEITRTSSTGTTQKGPGAWLKILGLIPFAMTAGPITGSNNLSAEMMEVLVNWSTIEGQDFSLFVYNQGAGAITTGAFILAVMEIYGVWLRD